jgi:lysophospholipase L1-like esterase
VDTLAFQSFIALGDSISLDLYPAADVALRHQGKASTDRLGAASLLHHNDDRLWPEFRGRDLATLTPGIRCRNLSSDGATTPNLLWQVENVGAANEPTLITINIGGNDLLGFIGSTARNPAAEIAGRVRQALDLLLQARPDVTILITNVYDPSDGTNRLPGYARPLDREAEWLADYNDRLRRLAESDTRFRLADIHRHFLGHGASAPLDRRWYLEESIIEPNARGGSEVRRLWLNVLQS